MASRIGRSYSEGDLLQLANFENLIRKDGMGKQLMRKTMVGSPSFVKTEQEPSSTQISDADSVTASCSDAHKIIEANIKKIMKEQILCRRANVRMANELCNIRKIIRGCMVKIQRRKTEKGELYRIVYDHGNRRTEYTDNLKQAIEWYMEKVLGEKVRVDEDTEAGQEEEPTSYVYSKVTGTPETGKLTVMHRSKIHSDNQNLSELAKGKPTDDELVYDESPSTSHSPPKRARSEAKSESDDSNGFHDLDDEQEY